MNELWEEMYLKKNVNKLYQVFINTLYYLMRTLKLVLIKNKVMTIDGYLEE
jgi:hypothetical protein